MSVARKPRFPVLRFFLENKMRRYEKREANIPLTTKSLTDRYTLYGDHDWGFKRRQYAKSYSEAMDVAGKYNDTKHRSFLNYIIRFKKEHLLG